MCELAPDGTASFGDMISQVMKALYGGRRSDRSAQAVSHSPVPASSPSSFLPFVDSGFVCVIVTNHKSACSHFAFISKFSFVSMMSLIKACWNESPHRYERIRDTIMFTRRAELHTPTVDFSTCWHLHTRRRFSHMYSYLLLLLFCFADRQSTKSRA